MEAPKCPQRAIIQGLHAERNAVDARGAIVAKALCFHARRIGLERDFRSRIDHPTSCDRIQDSLDRGSAHERRRASAKEDAVHVSAWHGIGPVADLADESPNEPLFVDAVADVAVEIAVGTLRGAERPVHVDAEPRALRPGRRGSCWQTLRTRARDE